MEINGFEIDQFNQYNLEEGKKVSICPLCSKDRKKKTDKCLSVFWDRGIGNCNHCGELIQLHTFKKKDNIKNYVRPEFKKSKLSKKLVDYFKGRGISERVLIAASITEGLEWMPQTSKEENTIQFNYFRDNELINIKYRTY